MCSSPKCLMKKSEWQLSLLVWTKCTQGTQQCTLTVKFNLANHYNHTGSRALNAQGVTISCTWGDVCVLEYNLTEVFIHTPGCAWCTFIGTPNRASTLVDVHVWQMCSCKGIKNLTLTNSTLSIASQLYTAKHTFTLKYKITTTYMYMYVCIWI